MWMHAEKLAGLPHIAHLSRRRVCLDSPDYYRSLWISLGDFIANISATHSPGDGCQGLAIATTYLISQQSSDNRADADANRAIVCNRCRCRLLVRGCL